METNNHKKRTLKICFAFEVRNPGGRYPDWVKWLLENFDEYAVRYNDYGYKRVVSDASRIAWFFNRFRRVLDKLRFLPMLLASDVIVFSNVNLDPRLYCMARLTHKKILLDMFISQYQTLVFSRKAISEGSSRAKKLKKAEAKRLRAADKAVFLNATERDFYCGVLGATPRRSWIIPLDNQEKRMADLKYFKEGKERPVICWWGGERNPIHGLDAIMGALAILKERGIEFEFMLFGNDPYIGKDYYGRMLRAYGLADSVIPRYDLRMSDGSLEAFLAENCDLAFGPLGDEEKARNVVANKSLDCANMGIPLVTIESSAMREFFGDDAVFYCDDASPEGIAQKIEAALFDETILEKVDAAKRCFESAFSSKVLKEKFLSMMKEEW